MDQKTLPETTLKKEGNDEFPILKGLYDFFTPRCKKLVIWSYGIGYGGIETSLIEGLGAHVHIFDSSPTAKERFSEIETITTTHKAPENAESWKEDIAKKWILPNRLHLSDKLPFIFQGSLQTENGNVQLQEFDLSGTPRVDIVKVDYGSFTSTILYSLLQAGYRPGLLFVKWNRHPDEFSDTMLCAGHLQNCGYILLSVKENWFLYLYMDHNIYETCSWSRTDVLNPMLDEFKLSIL